MFSRCDSTLRRHSTSSALDSSTRQRSRKGARLVRSLQLVRVGHHILETAQNRIHHLGGRSCFWGQDDQCCNAYKDQKGSATRKATWKDHGPCMGMHRLVFGAFNLNLQIRNLVGTKSHSTNTHIQKSEILHIHLIAHQKNTQIMGFFERKASASTHTQQDRQTPSPCCKRLQRWAYRRGRGVVGLKKTLNQGGRKKENPPPVVSSCKHNRY